MKHLGLQLIAAATFSVSAELPKTVRDVHNHPHSLKVDKALVLAWTSAGCPMSKLYRPRLDRLAREFAPRGVRVLLISSSSQDTLADLRALAKPLQTPIIQDVDGRLARALKVGRTTEAILLGAQGRIEYRGAVDDQYGFRETAPGDVGAFRRQEPRRHHLREALLAVLDDKPIVVKETRPFGCALHLPEPGQPAPPAKITFHRHIEPLLQQNCQECHHRGGGGPFALETYKQTKGWAKMIGEVVAEKRMPPWNADPKVGHFRNARGLTEAEIRRITEWVKSGAPQGDPAQAPPRLSWDTGLGIGPPDKVITLPPFDVPAEGRVPYRYVPIKLNLKENQWVRAAEFVSDTPEVLHHTLAFLKQPRWRKPNPDAPWTPRFNPLSVLQGARPGERGFWIRRNQQHLRDFLVGQGGGLNGYFLSGIVGDRPMVLPESRAKFLPFDASIIFQLHYQPNGRAARSTSRLRLWFTKERPREIIDTRAAATVVFRIPPHAKAHEVRASHRFQRDTLLLSLQPHMHYRGGTFRFVAELPDGRREPLLHVPRFDFDWQHRYELAQPRWFPAGTRLHAIGTYDNSADNPNNPDPTQTVWFGLQSEEEMFIGFFEAIWNAPKPREK